MIRAWITNGTPKQSPIPVLCQAIFEDVITMNTPDDFCPKGLRKGLSKACRKGRLR